MTDAQRETIARIQWIEDWRDVIAIVDMVLEQLKQLPRGWLCDDCGSKRCDKSGDHRLECSNKDDGPIRPAMNFNGSIEPG